MVVQGISVFTKKAVELTIQDGGIEKIEDLGGATEDLPYVAPGFIDLQVNGYHGSDYSLPDLTTDHVRRIVERLARSGTTQHVPTFVSMPQARLLRNLRTTVQAVEQSDGLARAIPGLHVEGPYISTEDGPRGVHDPAFVRLPSYSEFAEWQEAANGMIVYVTVAPEREGAIEFIRRVVQSGVKVAIGHTGCSPDDIGRAVDAGATMSTHLGNGSHTMIPRLRNCIMEQLGEDRLMAGLISDGFHLPPSAVRVFSRSKGPDRLVLVSDVALLGGFEPGVYKWGNLDVEVFADGHLGMPGTSILAGAAHLLDWDIPRYMEFTGRSIAETVRLCTSNPARFLGISEEMGEDLQPGARADLTLFSYTEGDRTLTIKKTIRSAEVVYSA